MLLKLPVRQAEFEGCHSFVRLHSALRKSPIWKSASYSASASYSTGYSLPNAGEFAQFCKAEYTRQKLWQSSNFACRTGSLSSI